MAEPLFRKGDVLVWSEFRDSSSPHYREAWGPGPFTCPRDVEDPLQTISPYEVADSASNRHAWAKRFKRNEFLSAVSKAVASEATPDA